MNEIVAIVNAEDDTNVVLSLFEDLENCAVEGGQSLPMLIDFATDQPSNRALVAKELRMRMLSDGLVASWMRELAVLTDVDRDLHNLEWAELHAIVHVRVLSSP